MASRRVRIKGIANIPQRRKPGNGPADSEKNYTEVKSEQKEHNLTDTPPPTVKEKSKDEGKKTKVPQETENNKTKSDDIAQATVSLSSPVITADLAESPSPKESSVKKRDVAVLPKKESEERNNVINIVEIENSEMPPEATDKVACQSTTNADITKPTLPIRRRFLKPTVSTNIINRKPKDKAEEPKTEQDKENLQEPVNINLNETVISSNSTNISPLIQKIDSTSLGPFITKSGLPHLVKYNRGDNSAKSGSDTEYPPPPPSPNKLLNRTRIKAVPRLDQRRTSFSIGSASESEDDTRRSYTRIRNDSVCSVASGINETHQNAEAASPVRKELISVIQRKCKRTEQSRKLAEARREFYMKFHNGTPDKQRLTMIDLIFYNPTSNPMTQKKKRKISELKEEPENTPKLQTNEHIASKLEKMEEERTDDPLALSDDEEAEIPAPQIKIGMNGEIIVDEKSLVIEHTDAKKDREALANSEVVDGDFDTSYGVYKRVKRSKDWSREETLRFYKALNTIGTDFTMMCELFPKRTRRELKMKFKKEERMNKNLVDKAVMRPVEFDLTELRRDLEIEERREEEMKRRKKEKEEMKEKIKTKKKKSEIKGIDGINEQESTKVEVKKLPPRRERKSVRSSYDVLKNGINSVLEDSEDNLPTTFNKKSDSGEESSEEDDPLFTPITSKKRLNILKPKIKKSKRFKKNKIKSEEEKHTSKDESKSDAEKSEIVNNHESLNQNLEPGSIMIVSSKMPNGETLYKVFMVTDQQNKQPINLEPNMLQNLTQNLGAQQATTNYQNILTISAQKQIENNVTINEGQELQDGKSETDSRLIINNETEIITSDNIPVVQENASEITSDSIIFPFDEYINSAKQNITISHEDSKLVIVTEKSNN